MAREFFHIVRGKTPAIADFRTQREQGRRLKQPAYEREWAEGISVYDDFERVCAVARKFGFRAGSYVVKIVIPEDAFLEFRQTFDDPHHFTIYARAQRVMALIEGIPFCIPGSPGE
ncbi:MAG: hypothetical protein H0V00_11435 [Chloroflexia bacterium]|nr:hypothetical protein [Chloroflexia bacterium]